MHRTSWLFPIVLVACFHSTSEDCSDGTFCPQGLRCVGHGGGCFDPLQCSSGDGEPCGVNGTCAGGECIASVCGDGIVGRGETCDDANQLSHDGCSSQCQTEMPDCQPLAMLDACAA
jgi:cysteine-rich repeat protein